MRMNKGKDWDINDNHFPKLQTKRHDLYNDWPDGHCRLIYHSTCEEAKKHTSGWAMRNTNNHNVNILKKSCLGVLVCSKRCVQRSNGTEVAIRPAICDKARKKQQGKICPNLDCDGILEIQPCRGHCGYPVTHFWRHVQNYGILFQAKGFHDHAKPCTKSTGTSLKRKVSLKRPRQPTTELNIKQPATATTNIKPFSQPKVLLNVNNNVLTPLPPHYHHQPLVESSGTEWPLPPPPPPRQQEQQLYADLESHNHLNNNSNAQCAFKTYLPSIEDTSKGLHSHSHWEAVSPSSYETSSSSSLTNRPSGVSANNYDRPSYYPESSHAYEAVPPPPPLSSLPPHGSSNSGGGNMLFPEEIDCGSDYWMYCNEMQEMPSAAQQHDQQQQQHRDYTTLWPLEGQASHQQQQQHDAYSSAGQQQQHYALDHMVDFSNPGDIFQFEESFFPTATNSEEHSSQSFPAAGLDQQHPVSTASSSSFYPVPPLPPTTSNTAEMHPTWNKYDEEHHASSAMSKSSSLFQNNL